MATHPCPPTSKGLQSPLALRRHFSAASRKIGKIGKNGNATNVNSCNCGHFGHDGSAISAKIGKNGNAPQLPAADLSELTPLPIRAAAQPGHAVIARTTPKIGKNGNTFARPPLPAAVGRTATSVRGAGQGERTPTPKIGKNGKNGDAAEVA